MGILYQPSSLHHRGERRITTDSDAFVTTVCVAVFFLLRNKILSLLGSLLEHESHCAARPLTA